MRIIVVMLLLAYLLSSYGQTAALGIRVPVRTGNSVDRDAVLVTEELAADESETEPILSTLAAAERPARQAKEADSLFRAKFEGDRVAGSGEVVNGEYRFAATKTDGEAWHVKLESNYPTVSGRDYRVTYHFHSNVRGKVKFGDFQEYEIQPGENTVTGMLIATGGTSYLDLQLGMLPPFSIDFHSVEVEEYADEVEYEDALSVPVNFEKEKIVYERHDQGYAPIPTREKDGISLYYFATAWDTGVWKSRLYVKTSLVPEAGVHYRITADVSCDEDMPFEVLFNNGDEEKGYGALYGQSLTAGETKQVEAVIIGSGGGDSLVLQFSLGEAPEESTVKINNVHVEKIRDRYTNMLPSGFALNKVVETGKILHAAIPTSFKPVSLSNFSWSGVDTVFTGADDGYVVSLEEGADSATMRISQAPASDRGVWKAKLYAATGVTLQAGTTYRIKYDLQSEKDQAEYEVCFDGSTENAYGALYGRSLTAGGTDSVEYFVTPEESRGPLTLRLQLGKTDTTEGNTVTLRNLSVESVTPQVGNPQTVALSAGGEGNTWEEHTDGLEQTLELSGGTATLNISKARSEGGVWSSKLFIRTGVTPEAGARYRVSAALAATGDTGEFEILYQNTAASDLYGGQWGLTGAGTYSSDFTAPADGCGELVFVFQLGNSAAGNTVTVSDLQVRKLSGGEAQAVELSGFAYPVTTDGTTATIPAAYASQSISLGLSEAHDDGYDQTLSENSLTINTVPGTGVWCSKLFVDTGVTPEQGAKYKVTASVNSVKAIPQFEICYNNGGTEKGYGALYNQSIGEGESKSLVYEFDVASDASTDKLVLQFMLGKSPAGNTFTVSSVKVEKLTHEQLTTVTVPAGYQAVTLSGLSASEGHDDGYEQSLSGMALSISAVPASDTGVWKSKLFVDTQMTPEAGAKYQVTASMTAEKGFGFEICYNKGSAEKGYGALYGQSIADSETKTFTGEFEVPSDAVELSNLVLQFQLGSSPAENTITVNSVTVSKWEDEHQSQSTTSGDFWVEVPVALSASEGHDDGFEQSVSGTTLTVSTVPTVDPGVWCSKLFANTGTSLEAGAKYKVTANIGSTKAMDFEICLNNGDVEKGYEALYGLHLDGGESKDFIKEFDVPSDLTANNLVLQFMLGKSPAGNAVTLNSVTVEKWVPEHQVTTGGTTDKKSFDLECSNGTDATLSGNGSSATATVTTPGDDWHVKLYAKPGVTLEAGSTYQITMNVTGASGCTACYKNTSTGAEDGFGTEAISSDGTVTHTVTPTESGTMEILLKIGNVAANTAVTVSDISITKLGTETPGDNLMTGSLTAGTSGSVNFWAHEDYAAALTGDGSSASLAISNAPAEGREAWKVKLFVETGIPLSAGKHYRISADVSASADTDYEICYNNGAEEKGVGALYGLHAATAAQTAVYEATPGADANLVLQFNLGWAVSPDTVTVSNVKVEELSYATGDAVLPSFSYDSVGNLSTAADAGYITSLDQDASSATLRIHEAPGNRNPWNVKLNVRTGFTPAAQQGYRISFDIDAAGSQDLFEVFFDGNTEAAYGALYGQSLSTDKKTVSALLMPGDSRGELTLQIRLGKTNGTGGNTYTVSNLKIEEVTFRYTQTPETKEAVSVDTQKGYQTKLERKAGTATLKLDKTPSEGREPWKNKLFVVPGTTLRAGQKYRISMDVKSIIPAPFEICFNNGGEEKGLGAIYGLLATPSGYHVEYVTYPKQDTLLELQLSLGNCAAPNSIIVSGVKVERAGAVDMVSDTVYTF